MVVEKEGAREKVVVEEVEVPGETVVVEKVVEKVVVEEVEVPGETVVVERVVEVEVPGETVVVEKVRVEEKVREVIVRVATEPKYGGTLRVVSQGSITTLDSLAIPTVVSGHTGLHMYEWLFAWDADFIARPDLVGDWSLNPDSTSYTMTLRQGMTFHTGDPVTSDDVIASINRWLPAPQVQRTAGFISDVVKVDDRTFVINLNESFGALVAGLGGVWRPQIWPEAQANSAPFSEPITEWIGSGPYMLEEWEPGDELSIVRYEAYISRKLPDNFLAGGKQAYLDRIVWLDIPAEETKIAGLETGQWDAVDGAGLDFFQRLKDHPDIDIVASKPGNQSQVTMKGTTAPVTSNKLIRQAVQAAINAEDMMASLGDPALWILCPAVFYCGTPLESDVSAELYNQNDPVRAGELLAQAGYAGQTIVILNPVDIPQLYPLGLVLKPALEAAGMTIDMPAIDTAAFVSRLGNNDWDMHTNFCPASTCAYPDNNYISNPFANLYDWPGYVELVNEFVLANDLAAQKAAADKIQAAMYEDAYDINLGQFFPMVPHRRTVVNLQPYGSPTYYNVWLEQ